MANQSDKDKKLKQALRDNLKKRKAQSRKLGAADEFSVKLRSRELVKKSGDETSSVSTNKK